MLCFPCGREDVLPKIPQLAMKRGRLDDVPDVAIPEGYTWRTFREDDEAAWCEIIEGNIGEGWTADKFELAIFTAPQFDPDGLFLAFLGDEPAGTSCAWRKSPDETAQGILHMLAVREAHRNRGLGTFLTFKVLEYLRERGFKSCFLTTDDDRLAAIKVYLNLGFEPVYTHENHPPRWRAVFRRLGLDPADLPPAATEGQEGN